jgi:heat shock protein HslJ
MKQTTTPIGILGFLTLALTFPCMGQASNDPALSVEALRNAEYMSDWTRSGTAKLTNSEFRETVVPGSASEIVVRLTDHVAYGYLDGQEAVVVVLVTTTGGSGTFYDLSVVFNQGGKPVNVARAKLGDRVKIKSLAIKSGEIEVEMVAPGPDDPMCCPTQRLLKKYAFREGRIELSFSHLLGRIPKDGGGVLAPENVTFNNPDLARSVTGISMSAGPYDISSPPGPQGHPQHVVFAFDGTERLRIYPAREYEAQWKAEGDATIKVTVHQLRTLLEKRPASPKARLPILPPPPGGNDLAAQVKYLDFANGSGIRFVGRVSQDTSLFLDHQLDYYFQGLTRDGKYFVSFIYPVSILSVIPKDIGGLSKDVQTLAEKDFNNYLKRTRGLLDASHSADFTPDLSRLDTLLQSITIDQGNNQSKAAAGDELKIIGPIWKWQQTLYNNDTKNAPSDPAGYTLGLLQDGNVRIQADCNSGGGHYTLKGTRISIEILHTTLAACPPGSLEKIYIRDLGAAVGYFIEDNALFIDLKYDSGTMKFTK